MSLITIQLNKNTGYRVHNELAFKTNKQKKHDSVKWNIMYCWNDSDEVHADMDSEWNE